mmetsp:Transcript_4249/g.8134  ORF Transcript_4249/g.8134 Transcript_4249/m.8134 type:complete len:859 (-) Transcript_4249:146-2722(-)|eukprot:CAMPEP_0176488384 /NCGR_PEP_ID=MMETSP0200_2-20121128/6677_1 /TAXON_ID=947934 /ORGANISM="Chaetoceros sp., Strain GSL56" /LENGTH=858 /DNA_ID=CAMNT_0017885357 /DNA_START=422 /DNA_END=2998 /DNA_ORIENTATION=+
MITKQENSFDVHSLREEKVTFVDLTCCTDGEEGSDSDDAVPLNSNSTVELVVSNSAISLQPMRVASSHVLHSRRYNYRGDLCTIDETENLDTSTMPPPLPKFSFSQTSSGVKRSSREVSQCDEARNSDDFYVLDYSANAHHDLDSSSSSLVTMNSSPGSKMRTSAITLFDSNHGRQRRQQRVIARREIQSAMKHGRQYPHPSDPNLLIYEYQGKRHIVTKKDSVLVTTMGIRINPRPKFISEEERRNHYRTLNAIRGNDDSKELCSQNRNDWTSHSILIVDKSGSMRNSDVHGCRTRLGAVWLSIAQDFIEYRLQAGMAGPLDVVTIILMGEDAKVLIDRYPTNNVLYNLILKYYRDSETADILYQQGTRVPERLIRPAGHGCYAPSLNKAEDLFIKYDNSSSALQLLLLSDGRPSDSYGLSREKIQSILKSRVEKLASRFGKRFNFAAIGMGNLKDYDCLKSMVESCQDFGGNSTLQVPGLSCAEIGAAFSSVATSLMACQTELKEHNGNNKNGPAIKRQRRVRTCLRENRRLLPALTEIVDETFKIYMNEKVERYQYNYLDEKGMLSERAQRSKHSFLPVKLLHPEARGVAFKYMAFGEGQERFAHQFFEIAADGKTVVGIPLVAKESKFVDDIEHQGGDVDWIARDQFVERFCRIQNKSQRIAEAFNLKLNSISTLDPSTPRVSFVDCYVYYLTDDKRGQFSVIVEPKLEGNFEKWNNNNGWRRQSAGDTGGQNIITIKEEDDESNELGQDHDLTSREFLRLTKNEVAQAFSHFSYHFSRKQALICDLQGVYDKSSNLFRFTDPVIHYHNARKESGNSRFGRTDMGQKGIDSFFRSHKCNQLCNLVTKGFMNAMH